MRAPVRLARADLPGFDVDRHAALWDDVPELWRRTSYPLEQDPFHEVFVGLNRTRTVSLEVESLSPTIQQELSWWVWHCYATGCRRINLVFLRNVTYALSYLQARRPTIPILSVLEVARPAIQRAFQEYTYSWKGQLPAPASTKNTDREAAALHEALALRHEHVPWWQQDTWNSRADNRIPVREHEPTGGQSIRFASLKTPWLKSASKYYFRILLETRQQHWGSLLNLVVSLKYFDDFLYDKGIVQPALVDDPAAQLHALMLDYLTALRSRVVTAGDTKGKRLSDRSVIGAQLNVAALYLFLTDHKDDLAAATGDQRFLALTDRHTRLWRPSDLPNGRARVFGDSDGSQYIADADLSRMTELISIIGLPRDETTTFARDGQEVTVRGLGDPSVMRAWLIQALTGRRASEILMSDFNPLHDVPGLPGPTRDDEEFVAKYRYQQTKVRQAPNTILVGRDVVTLIREQQAWTRQRLRLPPEAPDPKYLFPALTENHTGSRHRGVASYGLTLEKLTHLVDLKDQHGRLIKFSKSHRLRHTKATNLLNLGAPVHVVVRYMGHRSPEMTMHYAATLAQTAEREFLRTQRVGQDGKVLGIAAQDLYEMTALSQRTDRILPTGLCLLPPAKRCDKGNACYSCEFFATDHTQLDGHRQLLADTHELITRRQQQVLDRTGRRMSDDNVWLTEQAATIRSLELIIDALEQGSGDENTARRGCGVRGRDGYQPGPVPIELTTRQETTYA